MYHSQVSCAFESGRIVPCSISKQYPPKLGSDEPCWVEFYGIEYNYKLSGILNEKFQRGFYHQVRAVYMEEIINTLDFSLQCDIFKTYGVSL